MEKRTWFLIALLGAPLALLFVAVPPIPQDPRYHALADARTFFAIPNFLNVASNLAFIAVGAIGFAHCIGAAREHRPMLHAWCVFFAGTLLVGFGSAYYHWAPRDGTLLSDRLPMTIAFMGLFAALVAEHLGEKLEHALLLPALLVGLASLAWWRYAGDLRLYAWVQFAPLVALLFIFFAYSARYSHRVYLLYGAALYVLAKIAESLDAQIFGWTSGAVSGHTLKHLLAAGAPLCVYLMLLRRAPLHAAATESASVGRVAAARPHI